MEPVNIEFKAVEPDQNPKDSVESYKQIQAIRPKQYRIIPRKGLRVPITMAEDADFQLAKAKKDAGLEMTRPERRRVAAVIARTSGSSGKDRKKARKAAAKAKKRK